MSKALRNWKFTVTQIICRGLSPGSCSAEYKSVIVQARLVMCPVVCTRSCVMKDGILNAISRDGTIRAVIAITTDLVEDARHRHNLSYTATAALGRALTGGVLLAPLVAREGQVALKFQGNGPIGKMFVDASPKGTVRG